MREAEKNIVHTIIFMICVQVELSSMKSLEYNEKHKYVSFQWI